MSNLIISTPTLPKDVVNIYELYRPKVSGGILSVAHAGVGFEESDGNITVLHRTPENGTHISSYQDFSANQIVNKSLVNLAAKQDILIRANYLQANNQGYKPLTHNCEHLVNYVLHGKVTSEQVKNSLVTAGVSYGLLHLVEKPTKQKLVISGLMGLFSLLLTKSKKLS